ncbi:MAG: O-antigen ligase family protein [Planctomycetota bacterium]
MPDPSTDPQRAGRVLAWLFLPLLTLPFHPLWVDFEQVRRGLLLAFVGIGLIACTTLRRRGLLPPVRGERTGWLFVLSLVAVTVIQASLQAIHHDDKTPWSLQLFEAVFRIAHWLALMIVLRLGAASGAHSSATPIAATLLATSLFGLLQRLGVAEVGGYGVEREPVSTLGNLNVASEWTAVAAVATAVLLRDMVGRSRPLGFAALAASSAYLVVNHSRSGLVALPICIGLLALLRWRRPAASGSAGHPIWLVPAVLLLGAACGWLVDTAASRPAPLNHRAEQAERDRSTVTLDVRFEIARSCKELILEAPLFGHGPGQFQVQYPRVRSQAEIEASSLDRQFAVEVRTAHDDWLELLVDGGLPILVLFATMLFALQRGTPDKVRLLPLFALLLLMLVRAPIGNAPAAATAFWLVGTLHHGAAPAAIARVGGRAALARIAAGILGLLLVGLGVMPIAGNQAFVPYVAAQRDGEAPPLDAVRAAGAWMPYEPRWLQAEAKLELDDGNLPRAAHLAARAVSLRPFSPPLLLLLAEVLARGGRYGEAIAIATQALRFDPGNPELRVLKSTALAELGDIELAIRTVVRKPAPHRILRAALENHFAELAVLADKRNEPKAARRFLLERAFAGLCTRLGNSDPDVQREVRELRNELSQRITETDRKGTDARFFVCGALEALGIDRTELADGFAAAMRRANVRLEPWQAELLKDELPRLRELPSWAPLLPPVGR